VDTSKLFDRLQQRFPDELEPVAPEQGDPCLKVGPGLLKEVAEACRVDPELRFDCLHCITGIDFPAEGRLAVVYNLFSFTHRHRLTLRVELSREGTPKVPSVAEIWPAADWHERETYDLLGVIFDGHPDLRRLLLPDDWQGYPLRKDYKNPEYWHGIRIDPPYDPPGGWPVKK
jgi:NADH-quinone oxidoreductase subunit C